MNPKRKRKDSEQPKQEVNPQDIDNVLNGRNLIAFQSTAQRSVITIHGKVSTMPESNKETHQRQSILKTSGALKSEEAAKATRARCKTVDC
jgi:hypothetical protein